MTTPNRRTSRKRKIDSYSHKGKERANDPPVGLVDPKTDPDKGEKETYQYDPHTDPIVSQMKAMYGKILENMRTDVRKINDLSSEELTRVLAYAGLVLIGYELVKSMIVNPIKRFYRNTTFGKSMPFSSYEEDVLSRHLNEFEACLLYLRDFMEAINSEDLLTIQSLRKHRNELSHDLVDRLANIKIDEYQSLFENVDRALFKLSKYRMYMEMGIPDIGIDWDTAKGYEYLLFEAIVEKVRVLNLRRDRS